MRRKRPDLKIIITSATIDPESFAAHFDDAPIIEVEGRTYPVEVRYRPLTDETADDDVDGPGESGDYEAGAEDQIEGIISAVDELSAEDPGDILVFLSGEREIRDTADALEAHLRKSRATARLGGHPALRPALRRRARRRCSSRTPGRASCSPRTSPRPP